MATQGKVRPWRWSAHPELEEPVVGLIEEDKKRYRRQRRGLEVNPIY